MAGKSSDSSLIMQVDDSTKTLMETIQRGITQNIAESIDEMRRRVSALSDDVKSQTDSIDSIEMISFIDETFGVSMTGVAKENFQSIDTLTKYIVENK
jgi:acyl carrier protein